MQDDDDRTILVVTPTALPPGIPGAVEITADCGHQAWISPTGLQAQLSLDLATQCFDCVPRDARYGEPVPGATEELANAMGSTEAAEAVIRAYNTDPRAATRQLQAQARRARQRHRR